MDRARARVDELIEILLYTTNSLAYACEQLGFCEQDLTENELSILNDTIFQCGFCGYWHDACEEEFNFTYGSVCDECYMLTHEEEEDE